MHALVAAYLEYKPADQAEAERDQSLQQLMSDMPVNLNAPKLDHGAWQKHIETYPESTRG